jgi:hypothetical protein
MGEAYCHNCKKDVQLKWNASVEMVELDMVLVDIVGYCPTCRLTIRRIKEWLHG